MSDLEHFEGCQVRFVGTVEKPEWVAADVVAVLYPEADPRNFSNYLKSVPSEWKGHKKIMTLGGEQDMITLFEAGMYFLMARSNSPKAVAFQKWAFEEVLPTIRQTGGYTVSGQSPLPSALLILQEKRERLELIQLGMDLFAQLGGVDERTELQIKDLVRDIVLSDKLEKPALPGDTGRMEWPVSDRLLHLGYGVRPIGVLTKIGKASAALYRAKYGKEPPKREQFVDGTTRFVNCYSEEDVNILDAAIKQILGDPA